jgi:hypothetical protein
MAKIDQPPAEDLPDCTPFELALECIELAEQIFNIPLQNIADLGYVRLLASITPGIEIVLPAPDRVYYRLTDEAALALAVQAHGSADAMQLLREICSSNVWEGAPVPHHLRPMCQSLLLGKNNHGARQPGTKGGKNFGAILVADATARYLRNAFGMPLVTYEGSEKEDTAETLCAAFSEHHVEVSYNTMRSWLTHKKHKESRARAEAIIDMLRARQLEDLGLVKRQTQWAIGVGAQLQEIGRVTR